MKLGEIKIEALKLMNACADRDIGIEDLEQIAREEEYREYMIAMPGAINRCFADIEEKRVLPLTSRVLSIDEGEVSGALVRFSTGSVDIERITYRSSEGDYMSDVSFLREGDGILLEEFDMAGEYRLLYRPSIPPITALSDNREEVPVPDRIAVWIPQFVKGDLYRGDEPEEAAAARNLYEQQMAQIAAAEELKGNRQRLVKSVYDFSEV